MNWWKVICALSIVIYSSSSIAQDITDVEAKPYGSYSGGAIDSVDLASGNLMLNIPLISYPQLGSLPPLSFSVALNNAPYAQPYFVCDYLGTPSPHNPGIRINDSTGNEQRCGQVSVRYDTSPPGGVYVARTNNDRTAFPQDLSMDSGDSSCNQPPDYTTCKIDVIWAYEDNTTVQGIGAYLTSSFAGGIVTGQRLLGTKDVNDSTVVDLAAYQYSLVDPSGTTRELVSDSTSWNTYRTADGSGYVYIPAGSENAFDAMTGTDGLNIFDSNALWLPDATSVLSGVRLGTVYSPTGIKYTDTIVTLPIPSEDTICIKYVNTTSFLACTPRILKSTAVDPSGNTITRNAWYWFGYSPKESANYTPPFGAITSIYNSPQLPAPATGYPQGPYYIDSVKRIIPDVVTMQATRFGWQYVGGDNFMTWNPPGPGGINLSYIIDYENKGTPIPLSFNPTIFCPYSNNCHSTGYPTLELVVPPDPAKDIHVDGYGIRSITLPNKTKWQFEYADSSTTDLTKLTTPLNGTISYTYTTIDHILPVGATRCNATCHAIQSRIENDGLGHVSTTYYTYGVYKAISTDLPKCATNSSFAYWTTVTDPSGNDTVHSFCALGVTDTTPLANQYKEIQTDYYQGCLSNLTDPTSSQYTPGCPSTSTRQPSPLKTVSVSFTPKPDITTPLEQGEPGSINTAPYSIITTTPVSTTQETLNYSTLFSAVKIVCGSAYATAPGAVAGCSPSHNVSSTPWILPINYISPTTNSIGSTSGSSSRRFTATTYEFQSPISADYTNANMIALPMSVQNTDSLGTTIYSQTKNIYDEIKQSPGHNGNPTSIIRINAVGQNMQTSVWYNPNGMPYQTQDANGNLTYVSGFMDQCSIGATTYPQTVIKAYGSTTTQPETLTYNYDCYTNAMVSATDPNRSTTAYDYTSDSLGRLTNITFGTGSYPLAKSTTLSMATMSYPSMTEVDIARDQTILSDGLITSTTLFDGFGRTIQQLNSDGNYVCTTYNAAGQVETVSNPRSSACPAGDNLTTYKYDPFGRLVQEIEPDGNILWWCYDGIKDAVYPQPKDSASKDICSSRSSNTNVGATSWVDSSDEKGYHHQKVSDALGQLIAVIEPDPQTGKLSYETDYQYDNNGNLTSVAQLGGKGDTARTRTFKYNSLSQLMWTQNPETGIICYGQGNGTASGCNSDGYSLNGNLQYKTDARGITTTYNYDALNRITSKSSSDGTPSTCYIYDTATNGIGRLAYEWTQTDSCPTNPTAPPTNALTMKKILAYNALGSVTSEQQCVLSTCTTNATQFQLGYSYDLMGNLTGTNLGTLPGVQALNFTSAYNSPGGRLSAIMSDWIDTQHPKTLFSAPTYGPSGGLTAATYGAGMSLSRTYDNRFRITSESDTASSVSAPTAGSTTVIITGAEQTK